mmetsp:Transcript_9439/g.13385  ORF Transcript_9439/g.13385 Transcript_9439/m.13385 type:complete len:214 (-) Transcript_9439:638-1279(-)
MNLFLLFDFIAILVKYSNTRILFHMCLCRFSLITNFFHFTFCHGSCCSASIVTNTSTKIVTTHGSGYGGTSRSSWPQNTFREEIIFNHGCNKLHFLCRCISNSHSTILDVISGCFRFHVTISEYLDRHIFDTCMIDSIIFIRSPEGCGGTVMNSGYIFSTGGISKFNVEFVTKISLNCSNSCFLLYFYCQILTVRNIKCAGNDSASHNDSYIF